MKIHNYIFCIYFYICFYVFIIITINRFAFKIYLQKLFNFLPYFIIIYIYIYNEMFFLFLLKIGSTRDNWMIFFPPEPANFSPLDKSGVGFPRFSESAEKLKT